MRVLVCGSRHFQDYKLLKEILDGYNISTIIHGKARGADALAGEYGKEISVPVIEFPALWDEHGKSAGPIRNRQMLVEGKPDFVIAFRGVNSRGTQNMIDQARKAGIETVVVDVEDPV